ncbi:RNA polymerase sigma factor [Egicoccus sp. AB-alg2]|uniref:RNA polymerase sigma factor n=1 Tax=Egicoccus sp. AB-alg2 TaxID=3242693 RepID=UPI00359E2DFD
MADDEPDRAARFRALYLDTHAEVLRFALRRVEPAQAEDVVADAYLVAWRRLDEAPQHHDDQRAWLFGVARHCLLNSRRGHARHQALAVRIATVAAPTGTTSGADDGVADRLQLAAAWRRLRPADQEALALTVFEELTSPRAAEVLGISPVAFRLRLLRARRALRRQLDATAESAAANPAATDPASTTGHLPPTTWDPTLETRP